MAKLTSTELAQKIRWLRTKIVGRYVRIYPCEWAGSRKHPHLVDQRHHVTKWCDMNQRRYSQGNDAPKGGTEGNYVKITLDSYRKLLIEGITPKRPPFDIELQQFGTLVDSTLEGTTHLYEIAVGRGKHRKLYGFIELCEGTIISVEGDYTDGQMFDRDYSVYENCNIENKKAPTTKQ